MTSQPQSGAHVDLPKEAVQHPAQSQGPPDSRIASYASPTENKVQVERLTRYQRCEQYQDGRA